MDDDRVVIECRDCELRESFPNLGRARLALDEHESASGHAVDWQIRRLDPGVEQAGADAGVCGIAGSESPGSPLVSRRAPGSPNSDPTRDDE